MPHSYVAPRINRSENKLEASPHATLARISVRGVVQGVGFRPFVYGLATKHNLKGWVCNTSEDVKIEIEGEAESSRGFMILDR